MAMIYVSSTYSDLKEHREIVYRTLREMRHDVIAMEDYVAAEQRPLEKCLTDVAECDIYIGIFAWRYGYIPDQDNPEQRSITELEYRKAGEVGIPRLIFLLDDKAPWSPDLMDTMTERDRGQCITALRSELKREKTVSFFTNPDQLAHLVSVSVQQHVGGAAAETLKISWEVKARAKRRFINHMRRFAGAMSEEAAINRYMPLRLQSMRARTRLNPR